MADLLKFPGNFTFMTRSPLTYTICHTEEVATKTQFCFVKLQSELVWKNLRKYLVVSGNCLKTVWKLTGSTILNDFNFWDPKRVYPRRFWVPTLFCMQNFVVPKICWTKTLLDPPSWENFFWTHIFLLFLFWPRYFRIQIISELKDLGSKKFPEPTDQNVLENKVWH